MLLWLSTGSDKAFMRENYAGLKQPLPVGVSRGIHPYFGLRLALRVYVYYQCQSDLNAYCLWTRLPRCLGARIHAFRSPHKGWRTGLISSFLP